MASFRHCPEEANLEGLRTDSWLPVLGKKQGVMDMGSLLELGVCARVGGDIAQLCQSTLDHTFSKPGPHGIQMTPIKNE